MSINVKIPTTVVNLPILFDLVHPDKAIIVIKEIIPKKRAIPPAIDEKLNSASVTLRGNPSVVIIKIFVIANTDTKKKLAANTAAFMILLDKGVFDSETKKFAITVMENPPNKELISII